MSETLSHEPTVAEVLDALCAISETIPGVQKAYGRDLPRSLAAANMPCVLWIPGPVQPDRAGHESDDEELDLDLTRTYYGVLFVAPSNVGAEGEVWAEAVPFIDRFWDTFIAHQSLGRISPVLVRMTGDTGVRNDFKFSGQEGTGIRFELAVTSHKHIEYADYE